jgi:hypothetical protein
MHTDSLWLLLLLAQKLTLPSVLFWKRDFTALRSTASGQAVSTVSISSLASAQAAADVLGTCRSRPRSSTAVALADPDEDGKKENWEEEEEEGGDDAGEEEGDGSEKAGGEDGTVLLSFTASVVAAVLLVLLMRVGNTGVTMVRGGGRAAGTPG